MSASFLTRMLMNLLPAPIPSHKPKPCLLPQAGGGHQTGGSSLYPCHSRSPWGHTPPLSVYHSSGGPALLVSVGAPWKERGLPIRGIRIPSRQGLGGNIGNPSTAWFLPPSFRQHRLVSRLRPRAQADWFDHLSPSTAFPSTCCVPEPSG